MNWLIKEEPTHYSFDDLVRDGRTAWTGVRNPLAQKHLQSMRKGDRIFHYPPGDAEVGVGIAKARSAAEPEPGDKNGKLDPNQVAAVKKLTPEVTLGANKADKKFASFPLVRISRL